MFGPIGGSEFILILILALLLFGPRKLPQLGRTVGRALAEFRGATQEFRSSLEREVEIENLKQTKDSLSSVGRELRSAVADASPLAVPRKPPPSSSEPVADKRPAGGGAPESDGAGASDPPAPPAPDGESSPQR